MQDGLVIGVDIGGTKIAAALIDHGGEINDHIQVQMVPNAGADAGLAAVNSVIDRLSLSLNEQNGRVLRSIGICCPGPLDPESGIVINPPNLPCWRDFPLATKVRQKYSKPVRIDNDGNVAALAEALWGAGRGYRNVFYAGIGTGIGTGIVLEGRIYHGRTGAAAEGGHMSVDYRGPRCGCGKRGCIEAFASGPAIARRARHRLATGQYSKMMDLANGNLDRITSEIVGRAYASGDTVAAEVLRETVEVLSVWFGNIVDLLEPDVMIIGGGGGSMFEPFLEEIHNQIANHSVNSRCLEIPLLAARYGKDAGVIGAAALCQESPDENGLGS